MSESTDDWLLTYCVSQPGLCLVPIEALSSRGVSPAFAQALEEASPLPRGWGERFNLAFVRYWKCAAALHAAAPQYWLPPRCQHVALVTDAYKARPFFQPFHRNSWLLYAGDFEAAQSTTEFSACLMLYAERLGLAGQIVPALHAMLPYFLTLDSTQRRAFKRGCERTKRPDADGWRALGTAQSWVRSLFHETIRKPRAPQPGMRIQRENGLIVPADLAQPLAELQQTWGECASEVLRNYRAGHGNRGESGAALGAWLAEHQPQALLTGEDGEILWQPDRPEDLDRLEPLAAQMTAEGVQSICKDLEVIDQHTRRFLGSLRKPDELARPAPHMTEGGLSYVHADRRLIAYNIGPGQNAYRLWEASPPYERLMLGARTVHEWGHLAAESGWVPIPPERVAQRQAAVDRLGRIFDTLAEQASPHLQQVTRPLREQLLDKHESVGQGLTQAMLRRIEDYMANLVARHFLSDEEMDTYVRNNVASRIGEYHPADIYMELIRLAYEYQYLALSRIANPRAWFFTSTWVSERFIERGVVSAAQLDEIIDTVAEICACYEVDPGAFDFPLG